MDEHKGGLVWALIVIHFVISLFSYTNLTCSSYTQFMLLPEVTV